MDWQIGQTTTQQRLHDDDRDVALGQHVVHDFALNTIQSLWIMPILIVHLDLRKVPMSLALVVHLHHIFQHLDVAMIGESHVADATSFFLFHQELMHADVQIIGVKLIYTCYTARTKAAKTGTMYQVIVQIIYLQFLERAMIPGKRHIAVVSIGIEEGGQLGGDVVAIARMALQGDARGTFRLSAAIVRRCVEIVHAML